MSREEVYPQRRIPGGLENVGRLAPGSRIDPAGSGEKAETGAVVCMADRKRRTPPGCGGVLLGLSGARAGRPPHLRQAGGCIPAARHPTHSICFFDGEKEIAAEVVILKTLPALLAL